MLCCLLILPLVVFVFLIIERLTRSTIKILNRTINLSKLNIVNSIRSVLYILQYCSVSIVSDRFIWPLEKLYVIKVIFQQEQKFFLLRKQIIVYNVQMNVCVQNDHSITNFTRFGVQNFALFLYFLHFASNWYSKKRIGRIMCFDTVLDHSSTNYVFFLKKWEKHDSFHDNSITIHWMLTSGEHSNEPFILHLGLTQEGLNENNQYNKGDWCRILRTDH